jgi:hypothetical protein
MYKQKNELKEKILIDAVWDPVFEMILVRVSVAIPSSLATGRKRKLYGRAYISPSIVKSK